MTEPTRFKLWMQSLNAIYLAECTTLAAIFSGFKRMVFICCFLIAADKASRLNQLLRSFFDLAYNAAQGFPGFCPLLRAGLLNGSFIPEAS